MNLLRNDIPTLFSTNINLGDCVLPTGTFDSVHSGTGWIIQSHCPDRRCL